MTARVPTRCNRDERYFTDTYQAMPKHGCIFEALSMTRQSGTMTAVGAGVETEQVRLS